MAGHHDSRPVAERPDVLKVAAEAGGYDLRSLEAGYRLAKNATLLAEAAGQHAQARLTTRRPLMPALSALAEAMGYVVLEEGVECSDPDGVSLVLTPGGEVVTVIAPTRSGRGSNDG